MIIVQANVRLQISPRRSCLTVRATNKCRAGPELLPEQLPEIYEYR